MPKHDYEPIDLVSLLIQHLGREGYGPREVRRVLEAVGNIVVDILQQGHALRWPGVCTVRTKLRGFRVFKSNLPHLRGRVCYSRSKAKLVVKPEGHLKRYLGRGLIDSLKPGVRRECPELDGTSQVG
ncbi:MAG: hypothetical protein GC159_08060 [Phycisphaera sp.]|nr:hypothetical protein [Phycisphaera sp.]